MNAIEFFSRTVLMLAAQGRQSADLGGACLYRGGIADNGDKIKCAAGMWISDETYTNGLERNSITAQFVKEALMPEAKENFKVLESLQNLHDSPLTWKHGMDSFKATVNAFLHGAEAASDMWRMTYKYNLLDAIDEVWGKGQTIASEKIEETIRYYTPEY